MGYEKDIFGSLRMNSNSYINHGESRVYHPQLVAVYHQAAGNARWRVMRYKGGLPPLMICTALRAVMICQACGLDKKIRQVETCRIFWWGKVDSDHRSQ